MLIIPDGAFIFHSPVLANPLTLMVAFSAIVPNETLHFRNSHLCIEIVENVKKAWCVGEHVG